MFQLLELDKTGPTPNIWGGGRSRPPYHLTPPPPGGPPGGYPPTTNLKTNRLPIHPCAAAWEGCLTPRPLEACMRVANPVGGRQTGLYMSCSRPINMLEEKRTELQLNALRTLGNHALRHPTFLSLAPPGLA